MSFFFPDAYEGVLKGQEMAQKTEREEQIEFLMDHYEDPRNYGKMEDATVSQKGGNPGCGDIVTIYLKISPDDKVEKISFEGEGCTISQAAASIVTEMIAGKTLKEIEEIPHDAVIDIMGREIALTRPKCSTLGMNTVREAIRQYRRGLMLKEIKMHPHPKLTPDNDKSCPTH